MKTVASLLVAIYCAVASAGIYSANDCEMFNARNCWIDEGGIKTVFPKRSPKSVCLQDPVWLHEAILERKLAIQCVNSFPNQFTWTKSGLLINANEFPSPLSIVERVDYRMLYPSGRIKQICNPSKTMGEAVSYIATPYSDVSQFAVDKWDSTVFHEQGGFVDAGFVSNKIDRAQMQAWFDNIMKARSFTRFGSRGSDKVTYVTLDPVNQVDISREGNVDVGVSGGWYSVSEGGYPWWDKTPPDSETFEHPYSWKWYKVVERGGGSNQYIFYNVPPSATVELGVIVECSYWESYKINSSADEADDTKWEFYGRQIRYGDAPTQRWWYVGSKTNYGSTVTDIGFTAEEIGETVRKCAVNASYNCESCRPQQGVVESDATQVHDKEAPYWPCSGYPQRRHASTFKVYFFPRITLGDHTKWWN